MQNRKAFTMVELVFVIVVIGILTAVAIPKLAATRDDAEISKVRATVASVRNAVATERQTRILRGDFTNITALNTAANIFDIFNADNRGVTNRVLEYAVASCATRGVATACWSMNGANYRYTLPDARTVDFTLADNAGVPTNRFDCVVPGTAICRLVSGN